MPKKREKNFERELLLPGEGEVIGIIEQLMGYDRAMVRCSDGYTRLCRIPGRMRKRVWMTWRYSLNRYMGFSTKEEGRYFT